MLDWFINLASSWYLWIKVGHLIAIISWMAGLFYFPRLLVYHTAELVKNKNHNSDQARTFQVMEEKLFRIIMQPALFLSLLSGGILAIILSDWTSYWMYVKLVSVLGLVVFHYLLNHWRYTLKDGCSFHSERFFRVVNEIPTLLLVIIVICVVVKPF